MIVEIKSKALPRIHDHADPNEAGSDTWFTVSRRVAWSDTDPSSAYTFTSALRYAEDAEVEFLRQTGTLRILYPHVPRIYVEARYFTPARFDDEIEVAIALVRIGRSSLHFLFRITRDSTLCAVGRLGTACIGEGGESMELPSAAREFLMPHLRDASDTTVVQTMKLFI